MSNQDKSKEESVNELRVLHRRVAELEASQPQLKQAEEELIRKEKLAVLGQLAGGVGHELRNPLGVISNAAYSSDVVIKEGLSEGALACLTKPLDINLLLSFFSSLRRPRSIVIVDDDLSFLKTLADILEKRGFQVTQVADLHRLTDKLKPDGQVVILDMKLDSTSGLEVLKEIRKLYPCLPVILATGCREEMSETIKAALKINAYTCLYKPFQIDELIQSLTEIHYWELSRVLDSTLWLEKVR